MNNRALGLYGGTFDPVHRGHLQMAEAALAALPLAQVRLIPAHLPPHRETPHASARDRLAMLQLAVAGMDGVAVDERELHRGGISWTIDTLDSLRAEYGPARPLVWLLGADALAGLSGWKDWQQLPVLCHFAVLARPGYPLAVPPGLPVRRLSQPAELGESAAGGLYVLGNAEVPVSATAVRLALQRGDDAACWLSPAVRAYIESHRLYR